MTRPTSAEELRERIADLAAAIDEAATATEKARRLGHELSRELEGRSADLTRFNIGLEHHLAFLAHNLAHVGNADGDGTFGINHAVGDVRELLDLLEASVAGGGLRCVESGCADHGGGRGWTLRLDDDDELRGFCPDCDRREFGDP
jgi:hypothetical protein